MAKTLTLGSLYEDFNPAFIIIIIIIMVIGTIVYHVQLP